MTDLTLGVEEELQLLDAERLTLVSRAGDLIAAAPPQSVLSELPRSQVELVTPVCQNLVELREQVTRNRAMAAAAAAAVDLRIASCGTAPIADWRLQHITRGDPYNEVTAFAGQLADEQLIAGLHVHVGVDDPERAVGALNRIRDWLHVLIALSASSPYWEGRDSGFASWRSVHWRRWPVTGPPPYAPSKAAYDQTADATLAAFGLTRRAQLYWDARLSARFPTIEVRACDATHTVDDVVALAGLIRAMVATGLAEHDAGESWGGTPDTTLRLASWQAARFGLAGGLLSPADWQPRPAAHVVDSLLTWVRAYLDEEVETSIRRILAEGNGADRQRRAGGGRTTAELVVRETVAGIDVPARPRIVTPGVPDADERRLLAGRPPHHG